MITETKRIRNSQRLKKKQKRIRQRRNRQQNGQHNGDRKPFFLCCQPPRPVASGPSGVMFAAAITKKRWPNRANLSYCFVDGETGKYLAYPSDADKKQMRIVRRAWENWKKTGISLSFTEVPEPKDADFRISFTRNDLSYSYVGMDNQLDQVKKETHTMNFGWDLCDQPNTAEHEIGHALGLEHEHQNPDAGIEWNEEAVIKEYKRTQQWSEEEIRANVIDKIRGSGSELRTTKWDCDSIMHYYFEAGLIVKPEKYKSCELRPASYGKCKYDAQKDILTSGLSDVDKKFIRELYPPVGPVADKLVANEPKQINVEPDSKGNRHLQLDYKFRPSKSGKWHFELEGATMGQSAIVVTNNKSTYVHNHHAANEANCKDCPSLSANDDYIISALFDKTNVKGPIVLKATQAMEKIAA